MKAERRHELQRNQLADFMGESMDRLKPYARLILISLVAIVVVAAIILVLARQQSAGRAEAWGDYMAASGATDSAVLRDVANRYDGTSAALWAKQTLADSELMRGMTLMFRDREEATQSLEIARDAYQEVVEQTRPRDMLHARAYFGLAQTHEALNQPEDALQAYDAIVKLSGDSAIAQEARRRARRVAQLKDQEFFEWFASAEPPLPGSQSPLGAGHPPIGDPSGAGMTDPSLPLDLQSLPGTPDLSIPGTINEAPLPNTGPLSIPTADPSSNSDAPNPDSPDADSPDANSPDANSPDLEGPPAPEPTESPVPDSPASADESPAADSPASGDE